MKTRKEQITQIKGMISQAVADGEVTPKCATDIMDAYDAILALPLDVPSDGQRIAEQSEYLTDAEERAFYAGQKWMKEEIIKRNK